MRQEFFAELARPVRARVGPAQPDGPVSVAPADPSGVGDVEESVLLETAQRLAALDRPLRRAQPGVQEAPAMRLLAPRARSGSQAVRERLWWPRVLGAGLGRAATPRLPAPRRASTPPLPALIGVVAGLALALLGTVWRLTQPPAASAAVILQRAGAAARAVDARGVRTYVLAQRTLVLHPGLLDEGVNSPYRRGEAYRTESTRWFEAPDHVRDELEEAVLEPDGTVARRSRLVTVRDGTAEWLYRPEDSTVVVNEPEPAYMAVNGRSPYLPAMSDVGDLLRPGHACAPATLRGRGTVAGRATYIIEFGPSDLARCPPVDPAWRLIGRRVLWIDEATFFTLKEERYDRYDGQLRSTAEATRIEYNVPIDPQRFVLTPPPGTAVRDLRPSSSTGS